MDEELTEYDHIGLLLHELASVRADLASQNLDNDERRTLRAEIHKLQQIEERP